MSEIKKNDLNPVAEIREKFREIKKQNKIRSEKLRDEYIKEKNRNHNERKIAKPQRPPEVDV